MRPQTVRKIYWAWYDHDKGSPSTCYPVIRLGGKFLEDYGFRVGDLIEVEYQAHKIIITRKQQESDPRQNQFQFEEGG